MTRSERQRIGIEKWSKTGRGTLQWVTGVGKTRAGLLAIKGFLSKNKNKKIVVVVPTEYLKIQWIQQLVKYGFHNDVSVEIINSAINLETQIDFLILDEIHRAAADTFYKVFQKRKPKLVLGLTATFSRLDGKHAILAYHCPIVDIISLEEALENKWLSPYIEYKVLITPNDIDVYKQYNAAFIESFSYFNNNFNLAMNCVSGIMKGNKVIKASHYVRYEYAESLCTLPKNHPRYKDTVKSILAEVTAATFTFSRALQARKKYVFNHPKKIEIARKILSFREGTKAITFSATIAQAEKVGIGHVVHSGNTKKKNRLTMEEFNKLSSGVINTAKSLDEGADIKGLNLAIILSNSSSKTQKTQRVEFLPHC